ncbi:hypothetical protein J4771_06710 [Candidatus Kaistella beijingensis]|jgi:hypothetical protein|uniref:hypothetical protein n=1 Tax=Candidatus Kaistella beijingensis TaxID=2820270 RepID=UPI001CC589C5|nr:hypothetical protein [Candidatus Kaistella beijingensis]UBB91085.1 hypothetical protein J4771_06710 [Candidatus Kaistella beijingensis]HQD45760.1 hypothetical protein [Kaistella sp.]
MKLLVNNKKKCRYFINTKITKNTPKNFEQLIFVLSAFGEELSAKYRSLEVLN